MESVSESESIDAPSVSESEPVRVNAPSMVDNAKRKRAEYMKEYRRKAKERLHQLEAESVTSKSSNYQQPSPNYTNPNYQQPSPNYTNPNYQSPSPNYYYQPQHSPNYPQSYDSMSVSSKSTITARRIVDGKMKEIEVDEEKLNKICNEYEDYVDRLVAITTDYFNLALRAGLISVTDSQFQMLKGFDEAERYHAQYELLHPNGHSIMKDIANREALERIEEEIEQEAKEQFGHANSQSDTILKNTWKKREWEKRVPKELLREDPY
jgi:3-dehydroquinate synthase class II